MKDKIKYILPALLNCMVPTGSLGMILPPGEAIILGGCHEKEKFKNPDNRKTHFNIYRKSNRITDLGRYHAEDR